MTRIRDDTEGVYARGDRKNLPVGIKMETTEALGDPLQSGIYGLILDMIEDQAAIDVKMVQATDTSLPYNQRRILYRWYKMELLDLVESHLRKVKLKLQVEEESKCSIQ